MNNERPLGPQWTPSYSIGDVLDTTMPFNRIIDLFYGFYFAPGFNRDLINNTLTILFKAFYLSPRRTSLLDKILHRGYDLWVYTTVEVICWPNLSKKPIHYTFEEYELLAEVKNLPKIPEAVLVEYKNTKLLIDIIYDLSTIKDYPKINDICSVCGENEAIIALNCGHKTTCVKCTKNIVLINCKCPICRTDISSVLEILIPVSAKLKI